MIEAFEVARMAALRQLDLIGAPPSESFDRITRLAGQLFALGTSAISLTDIDRQWFMSRLGVTDTQLPRHDAPCNEVTELSKPLVIPDLQASARYAGSTLAGTGARFYAGVPLVTRDGYCLGALCVLGDRTRTATEPEMLALGDLAAMIMAQIELRHAFGRVDPVSGLPNRNQFIEDIDDLARDHPGETRSAVLIDLAQNCELDSVGRVMGPAHHDQIVKSAVRTLSAALPPSCLAYHVAATQFACVSAVPIKGERLEVIANDLAAIGNDKGFGFATTPALGVTTFVLGRSSPGDVLRTGYSAAQDSRINERAVSTYSPANDAQYQRRFNLLADFRAAMCNPGELQLVYQPRIDLATGRCSGVEALLRWDHPALGKVAPGEFIPLIEQTSLVRDATSWVLDRAIRQQAAWRRDGLDLTMSINVSAANLREDDLCSRVQLYLLKHQVPTSCIELEITESAIMEGSGTARDQLLALDAAGVRIAIDDFGTGYSSLSYLQKLPAHVVKIDQSFILAMDRDPRDNALVRSMIALSHDLGFRVVGEGVETETARARLMGMGCEEAQGYHFSRPLLAENVDPWVRRHDGIGPLQAAAAGSPPASEHADDQVARVPKRGAA